MAPENDLLAPPKQLHLLRILGKDRVGGVLTNTESFKGFNIKPLEVFLNSPRGKNF